MIEKYRAPLAFLVMALLLAIVGFGQSWSVALGIINLCIISAIMALGVNLQWGYAGLFNAGVMGFTALGGLTAVLISHQPIYEAWSSAGSGILLSGFILISAAFGIYFVHKKIEKILLKRILIISIIGITLFGLNIFYGPSVSII